MIKIKYKWNINCFRGGGGGGGNWLKKLCIGVVLKLVISVKELKWVIKKSVRRYEILKEMVEKNLGFNELWIYVF